MPSQERLAFWQKIVRDSLSLSAGGATTTRHFAPPSRCSRVEGLHISVSSSRAKSSRVLRRRVKCVYDQGCQRVDTVNVGAEPQLFQKERAWRKSSPFVDANEGLNN